MGRDPKVGVVFKAKDQTSKTITRLKKGLKGLATSGFRVAGRAARRFAQLLTASVAAGLALATRRATEFSQRMGEVQTLLGPGSDAQKSVKSMSKAVLDMTTALPKSADDLGAGVYQILSAGVEEGAEAMRVLDVSAKAAVGGLSTTLESVDALTTVINAYGGDASKATAISDNMFQTIKDGKITYTQLASSIGTVATTASLANVSFGDLSAAIAAMTKAGLDANITTTSLNKLILSIISPQDDAAAAARSYGVELSSASLAQRGFAGLMDDIARATGGNIDALQAMFPELRAFKAITVLAGASAAEFQRLVDNQANSAGAAAEAFEVMNDRMSQQWQLFKNKLNVVLIEFGDKLLPEFTQGMTDAAGPLETMRDWVRDNDEEIRKLGASFAAMIPVVIRFATFVGKLVVKFGDLAETLNDMADPSAKFSRGLISENAAFGDAGDLAELVRRAENFKKQIDTELGQPLEALKVELEDLIQEAARAPGSRAFSFNRRIIDLTGKIGEKEAELNGITAAREDALERINKLRLDELALLGIHDASGGGDGGGVGGGGGGGGGSGVLSGGGVLQSAGFGAEDAANVFGQTAPGARPGDFLTEAGFGAEDAINVFGQVAKAVDEITESATSMREALVESFVAAAFEAGNFGEASVKDTVKTAKRVAKVKVAEQVAAGVEDLAGGTWPPNPVQLGAAGKHFGAAAKWGAVAGVAAAAGGGGGGGAGSSRVGGSLAPGQFTRDQRQLAQGRRNVLIIKGRFDPKSTQFLDELQDAINELGQTGQLEIRVGD